MTLVPTPIYTTSNLKNLRNWLQSNQCIYEDRWKKNPAPLLWNSTKLRGKQICMSILYTAHWKFTIKPRKSFRINELWSNKYDTHKSTINKILLWTNNSKEILDQEKQSIESKKSEHPTWTLVTTFHKAAGEANLYAHFGYNPQTISNNTQGKVSGPMYDYWINANKQVNNYLRKDDNLTLNNSNRRIINQRANKNLYWSNYI